MGPLELPSGAPLIRVRAGREDDADPCGSLLEGAGLRAVTGWEGTTSFHLRSRPRQLNSLRAGTIIMGPMERRGN